MSLKLGCLTTVVISSPEAAKEVLKTLDHVLSYRISSDPVQAAGHHEFSFVWLPPFARWRFLRKITKKQLFSTQRLKATSALRTRKVQELMSFVYKCSERREAVNIARASFITSLNIISNSLLSTDLASFDDSKTSEEFQNVVIGMMEIAGKPSLADFFPFLGFLDLQGTGKEARLLMNKLFRVIQGLIILHCVFLNQVLVNVWAIGRDPSVWENPTQFEPERFLGRGIDVKGNDFELIPFGAGRRICPGMPLAFRIMHLVLASLLCSFDCELQNGLSENMDMSEAFGATLHKAKPLCAVPIKKRV